MKGDSRLLSFYQNQLAEREPLRRRAGQLELARRKELLDRFLPRSPARITDIGGGTGVYASWLASRGYESQLVDVVPEHVEEALTAGTFRAVVGRARALPDFAGRYDVALLLGPMCHLQQAKDRLQALSEAGRVVCEGGMVVAAFTSRGAVALDGYVKGWIGEPGEVDIIRAQLRDGFVHTDRSGFGAIAYFHLPSEARAELSASGLEVTTMLRVEGLGWVAPDFEARWESAEGRVMILESARIKPAVSSASSPIVIGTDTSSVEYPTPRLSNSVTRKCLESFAGNSAPHKLMVQSSPVMTTKSGPFPNWR